MIGTTGSDPSESMRHIPDTGEIRPRDRINVIGAGGPMGVMHVVRSICQGVDGVSLYAGDIDPERLTILERIAAPLAEKRGVNFNVYNPLESDLNIAFDYTVIMVPNPKIVCNSIGQSCDNAVINIRIRSDLDNRVIYTGVGFDDAYRIFSFCAGNSKLRIFLKHFLECGCGSRIALKDN